MASEPTGLRLGLVEFAEPTLLLIGQPPDLAWLAIEVGSRRAFTIRGASTRSPVSLHLVPTEQAGCLTRQGSAFEWRLTIAEATVVADQLRELAAAEKPAHAYLDPAANLAEVQILVSFGEYEPSEIFGTF